MCKERCCFEEPITCEQAKGANIDIAKLQAEVKQGHTCNACLKDQLKNGKHECCVCPDGCDVDGIILQLRSKITSQAAEIVELKADISRLQEYFCTT